MDRIKIEVTDNIAKVTHRPKRITSGTVGLVVEFSCDSHWDTLTKTAVFRAGNVQWNVADIGESAIVPWEVLRKDGHQFLIGLFGVNTAAATAIPTVWANLGTIHKGANPDEGEPAKYFPDTLDATMEAEDLRAGKIGYARGKRIIGTGKVYSGDGYVLPDTFILADEYGNEAVAVVVP